MSCSSLPDPSFFVQVLFVSQKVKSSESQGKDLGQEDFVAKALF